MTRGRNGIMSTSVPSELGQRDLLARAELHELINKLMRIRNSALELESSIDLDQFGHRRKSASNLLHYVALRRQDMRDIQEKLSAIGLSSLGRAESHVLYNLNVVIRILQGLAHEPATAPPVADEVSPLEGRRILESNTDALFGPKEGGRAVRMMVTMPSEAATGYSLVRALMAAGMDVMRINCAHDDESAWLSMIQNLRKAERELGRRCRVLMDIAGPKMRTGKLEPGPQVMRLKPSKDPFGRVAAPARVILIGQDTKRRPGDDQFSVLEVRDQWLLKLKEGSVITLKDARGARRSMVVTTRRRSSVRAELRKTTYLDAKTELIVKTEGRSHSTRVLNIPYRDNPIVLKKGDALVVTAAQNAGRGAYEDEPARVPCTLPEALAFVRPGERIWFDDGKIGGIVRSATDEELRVEVTHAAEGGTKLRADRGVNLPDTSLKLQPLTAKDIQDLRFISKHGDMVGYSFVRTSEDHQQLRAELARLGRRDMGIVLKIETNRAFEQLPSLLLESMRGPVSGVMIARGDLAVECGYERLAEVQEEILWMSEAAHMPTIWATQVLEGLTKNGIPSRAEVTDAAVGGRSECVMLNKGPHVVEALLALDSILRRMQAHQVKKKSMMRRLNIAANFFKTASAS